MALKNISVFLIKGRKNYKKNIRKNGTIRKKGGNMDKYTKFILTVIAVAMIGINFQLFGGDIISSAEAVHTRPAGTSVSGYRGHIWIDNWPSSITCK